MGKWFWSFFGVFFNFGPFLGTVVENAKHKRVAPGKNPSIDIRVPKMSFSKMYIFGDPIESECLVWYLLNSSNARVPLRADLITVMIIF